ncbi:5'(3')-deoxyribonucleotidase, mitochondrial [Carlito syrichta]|uniref:5'(3')-deoxyribonucleotidase, mitochondrial n=1 Tax=Carlito syrichta TaxID=1868482 RepID=A0A3Q0DC57_CARSF|nr:5'(3')-deoxyribonucleotidase, mitochondrial [Carlito syrichta]
MARIPAASLTGPHGSGGDGARGWGSSPALRICWLPSRATTNTGEYEAELQQVLFHGPDALASLCWVLTKVISFLARGPKLMRLPKEICPWEKASSIWESENFFYELEPLPGAVEAVKQMANLQNTEVFICTSPIKMFKYCPYEKYAWVEKHFGPDFLEQIVLTRDKTVVSADLLIDDRPDITGKWPATGAEPNPSWEHVLFTACHNQHLKLQPPRRRLHSWADDWKAILDSKRPG